LENSLLLFWAVVALVKDLLSILKWQTKFVPHYMKVAPNIGLK
jgi:hypothetical protein